MFEIPFWKRLENSKNILLSGAGGGFDVFAGLPLYFALKKAGKNVHFGNLTFANLYGCTGRSFAPTHLEISAESGGSESYLPERFLAEWFASFGEKVFVHTFHPTGVVPLLEAYRAVVEEFSIDAVVLIDGGTDSLMRGNEAGLGTPAEDAASLVAIEALEVSQKLLACIGFGVDAYHGICHAQFLRNTALLIKEDGFLGSIAVTKEMEEGAQYVNAVDWVQKRMNASRHSVVSSSIVSAIEGEYGNYHRTSRVEGSKLWINPLMSQYWFYDAVKVANRLLYKEELRATLTREDVTEQIRAVRHQIPALDWESIPI